MNVTVECAAVARATGRQLSRLVGGNPQFTTIRCWFEESSNDRKPACASWLTPTGGARPVSAIRSSVPACMRWYPQCGRLASGAPRASS